MSDRKDLPIPHLEEGDRVIVTASIIKKGSAKARVTKVNALTNDYICIGVEFDEEPGGPYFFYPFQCEVIHE